MKKTSTTVVKGIKIILSIFMFFFFINHNYSQTTNKGRKSTISYKNTGYGIIGRVHKKQLVEGQDFILFKQQSDYYNNSLKDTILNGVYHISENGDSVIKGTWKIGEKYSNEKTLVKGTFIVSNNSTGKGLNLDKNNINRFKIEIKSISYLYTVYSDNRETFTLEKQQNNSYNLTKRTNYYTLKTSLQFEAKHYQINFDELILNSENVNIEYDDGDKYKGSLQYRSKLYDRILTPKTGIYEYSTGEISVGDFHYQPDFNQKIILKGKTTFSDGTIGMNKWMEEFGLSYNQEYNIRRTRKSLTEMRNMAKSIWEEKERKLQEKELAKREIEDKKNAENQKKRNSLINKYGEYWGELVYSMEFTLGMTKEMVSEFAPKKYYKISKLLRDKNYIEIWEFDSQKMKREMMKENAETLLALSLVESMGLGNIESEIPSLVFTNGKLTEINQN